MLLFNHCDEIVSSCGVQQGDPLGPLLLSLALQPIVEKIKALDPRLNLWYLDDGIIVGVPSLLQAAWDIIRLDGPGVGLFPNAAKCEWIWLGSRGSACPLMSGTSSTNIPVTSLSELSILGVPLGPADTVSPFVGNKLLDGLRPLLDKLTAFEDSQAASFLLRVSFSAVRATHFMRTTPLSHWRGVASAFDSTVRSAFESIVGFPFRSLITLKLRSPLALVALAFVKLLFMLMVPLLLASLKFFPPGGPNLPGLLRLLKFFLNKKLLSPWTSRCSMACCLLLPLLVNGNVCPVSVNLMLVPGLLLFLLPRMVIH